MEGGDVVRKPRLELVAAPHLRDMCETKMRYRLVLDGKPVGQAYFNMSGYIADPDSGTV